MSVRPHPKQKTDDRYRDTWLIDYYDGDRKRHKIQFVGTEQEAFEHEHSIRISRPQTHTGGYPSLREAAPKFMEHYKLSHLPSGVDRTRRSLKILLKNIGAYQFAGITDALIEKYKRDRLSEGVTHSTINKELATLSTMCKWATKQGWCKPLQVERFPGKLTKAPFPTIPSRKEVITFIRAVPRKKRCVFALMYYLGLRVSEARGLDKTQINIEARVAIVRGKNNKQRIVPLNRKIMPYIRRGSLPPYAPDDLRGIIYWAIKRAGITTHITPHKLRHAFGIHMTVNGVSLRAVQEIMGHSSSQVTEIYTRLAADQLSKEMDKF